MIVTIFGATGMVGKELVNQALFKGHSVRAYGRNVFTAGFREDEHLSLVQGTMFDEAQVLQAVSGSDAVLSALGGGTDGTDKTRSLGMKHIIDQMEHAGVKRIVAVGGMGCLDAADGTYLLDAPGYPAVFVAVGKEHLKAFEYLQASDLNWTFVCPPDIIKEGPTGVFKTMADHTPAESVFRINAGDLALFMINELEKNEFVKSRVGISN